MADNDQTQGENSKLLADYAAGAKSLEVNGEPYDPRKNYDTSEYVDTGESD